jgi:hypothetical protein
MGGRIRTRRGRDGLGATANSPAQHVESRTARARRRDGTIAARFSVRSAGKSSGQASSLASCDGAFSFDETRPSAANVSKEDSS